MVIYTVNFGFFFPFWDQWELLRYIVNLKNGTIEWHTLWAQHNEHRIFFPRIIMLGIAWATHWNHAYELALNVALGTSIFFVLLYIHSKYTHHDMITHICSSVILLCLCFSLLQSENWTWGWQNQIFFSVLCAIATFYLITHTSSDTHLCMSIFTSFMGTFSFANGILIWPVSIFILILNRRINHAVMFFIAFALTAWLYYHDYVSPQGHGHFWAFLSIFEVYIKYVLVYLGSPVLPINELTRLIFGIVGLCIFIYLCLISIMKKYYQNPLFLFGVCLCMFGICSAMVTGIGRCAFGVIQSESSRYTTIANTLWYGLLSMYLTCAGSIKTMTIKFVLGAVSVFFVYSNIRFSEVKYKMPNYNPSFARMLINDEINTANAQTYYPISDTVLVNIPILKKYNLSVFHK
ncbi:MAG: hypothetical protein NW207_01595 [Cytophagales bacterium]|nr:hypothetical protein [Cytophagales bacterium]